MTETAAHPPAARAERFSPLVRDLLVLLLFIALTIYIGWPLLSRLDAVLIGIDNDVFINPWADWWTLRVLRGESPSLWRTEMMFYPNGANLVYHSFSHLNTAVSLALQPLIGVLPAFNISLLINYPLTGFAAYQLGRYLTRSTTAGIFAGIIFAFNSHNLYQSSHPVLLSIWCFPWVTLFFLRAVRNDSRRDALLAALFVFLGAATSTLLLIMMGLWMVALIAYLWFAPEWKRPSLSTILLFGAASTLLALPLLFPLLQDAIVNQNSSFVINPRDSIVADIIAPLAPHWVVWLWRGIYFGYVAIYLLLLARHHGRETRLWFGLLIVAYLFAIGPEPEIFGRPLNITLPWSMALAPIIRNMYRMNILISLGLSMMVAFGWLVLAKNLKSRRAQLIAAVIVSGLLYADYAAVRLPVLSGRASNFYTVLLDDVPDDVVLAQLPHGRQQDKLYMYYQTLHNHPITGGVISRPEPNTFDFLENNPLLRAGAFDAAPMPIPDSETVAAAMQELADKNVGYVIFHKNFMETVEIEAWQERFQNEPIYEDVQLLVYATDAAP